MRQGVLTDSGMLDRPPRTQIPAHGPADGESAQSRTIPYTPSPSFEIAQCSRGGRDARDQRQHEAESRYRRRDDQPHARKSGVSQSASRRRALGDEDPAAMRYESGGVCGLALLLLQMSAAVAWPMSMLRRRVPVSLNDERKMDGAVRRERISVRRGCARNRERQGREIID